MAFKTNYNQILLKVVLPSYTYTVGKYFSNQTTISIPFIKLIGNLCITVLPCLLGILLSHFFPKLKVFFLKIAKPFIFFAVISFLALALFTKFYTFKLFSWYHWIAGPLIPWSGYIIGGSVSWIARRPWNQCKTIAIETGIQNVGVVSFYIENN